MLQAGVDAGLILWRFYWNFPLAQSFMPPYEPGVDSVCNRNDYQEYFIGVKAAGT